MKKYNFNPGPSVLPASTIENTAKAIMNFEGTGFSLMEVSHRGKEFDAVMIQASAMMKELLNIPENYSVIFLGGGASLQFAMIPMNFLYTKAAYLDTGTWANKALKDAKMVGEVQVLASSKDKNYSFYPKNYTIPTDVDYFHITTNNTIFGTQIHTDITSPVPLIADASSDILSRPMDISKYAVVYGGVQKNIGPAGAAFVIIRNDMLDKIKRTMPSMLNYKIHVENGSMYNTPPVTTVYSCLQTLKWLKEIGGVKAIEKMNIEKAKMLYDEIDRNKMFKGTAAVEDRSLMNVCFVMDDNYKSLEDEFLDFAKKKGMANFKGHRSVGGFRASIYNAMPKEGVVALIDTMKEFEKMK